MTKYGGILPICFILASGCALFDSPEMSTETPATSVPGVETAAPAPELAVAATPAAAATPATRSVSVDDIRLLQVRLRELGFDPGPVDGIAGARTKAAFGRLEKGCTKLEPLHENIPMAVVDESSGRITVEKIPNREDTFKLQNLLRRAGFDPGPVDGIFGTKTKSLVSQLSSDCLMAKDFPWILDSPARSASRDSVIAQQSAAEGSSSKLQASGMPARADSPNPAAPVQRSQPRDEIRVLQLRLRDAGFDPGPFDGVMGWRTKSALEQYEASQRGRKNRTSLTTTISGQY